MKEKTFITITRQYGSGGLYIAEALAKASAMYIPPLPYWRVIVINVLSFMKKPPFVWKVYITLREISTKSLQDSFSFALCQIVHYLRINFFKFPSEQEEQNYNPGENRSVHVKINDHIYCAFRLRCRARR